MSIHDETTATEETAEPLPCAKPAAAVEMTDEQSERDESGIAATLRRLIASTCIEASNIRIRHALHFQQQGDSAAAARVCEEMSAMLGACEEIRGMLSSYVVWGIEGWRKPAPEVTDPSSTYQRGSAEAHRLVCAALGG